MVLLFLVPQDQIIPGARIYGRWPKNNHYYLGYVSKIDSRIHLKFDDCDQTSHDLNDLLAVTLDKNPGEHDLKPGTKVIAPDSKTNYYSTAKIIRKETKDNAVVFCVQYEDGKQSTHSIDKIRLLTHSKQGGNVD